MTSLILIPQPILPRCTAVFGIGRSHDLFLSSCLSAFRLYGPSSTTALCFSQPERFCGLAAHEFLAYAALPARPPRIRLTPRPSWPCCLSSFGLYSLAATKRSASAHSTVVLAPAICHPSANTAQLQRSVRFWSPTLPSWPRSLSAFGLYTLATLRPWAPVNPTTIVALLPFSL